jgi:tetratricopeptide (TPR) repeat protein
MARSVRGSIREARADLDGALADRLRAVDHARETMNAVGLIGALGLLATTYCELGRLEAARAHVEELTGLIREHGVHGALGPFITYAGQLGVLEELRVAIEESPGTRAPRFREAVVLGLHGDFVAAAALYADMGNPTLEAQALLDAAEQHIREGDVERARAELEKALEFHRSVDATLYIDRAERLLAQTQRASA